MLKRSSFDSEKAHNPLFYLAIGGVLSIGLVVTWIAMMTIGPLYYVLAQKQQKSLK